METQTWLSSHYKFISVENITILPDLSDMLTQSSSSHTSSTHIDLYDIPQIFYKRIIHTHCFWTLTEYLKIYINVYIYIYIYIWKILINLLTYMQYVDPSMHTLLNVYLMFSKKNLFHAKYILLRD